MKLFTEAEIKKAKGKSHKELIEIVRPLMDRINKVTSQENHLGYMAYYLENERNKLSN